MRKYLLGSVIGAVAILVALAGSEFRRQIRDQVIGDAEE